MKCKWYAKFEGVCTNGECPYRGDTCPTSEHPEVCKYAEEKPKPELNAEELVTALRICAGTECEGCPCVHIMESGGKCDDYIKRKAADMLEKLAAEKDAKKPENRVLTLEELKTHAGFLWNENRYDSFESEGEPAYAENDFLYVGDGNVDLRRDISDTYGKNWRCWLRKPTKEEMEGTPWEA